MANVKITALPANTLVTPGSDVLPLVSSGVTTKATPLQIVQSVLASPGPIGSTSPGSGSFSSVTVASLSGIVKANSGTFVSAIAGQDYAPATIGSSILYGNSAGGFNPVTIGDGLSFSSGILASQIGSGSVSSVGLSLPSIFSVTGSPITTTGILYGTFITQAINTVFAGPSSGVASTPGFRLLTASDIPVLNYASKPTGTSAQLLANDGSSGFSNVTIGSGLSFSTGTLAATAVSMVYPGAGIPNSTGSAWGTSYTTTGSGTVVALATSPTFVTPTLGVASATTINKVTLTAPATNSTLTIANGKTLTASNTLTFTGTDASSVAFGAGGTVLYSGGAGTFTDLTVNGNTILGDAAADTVTLNAQTVTLNNSTTISAASTKTLTLNSNAGSSGLVLDASNNVGIGTSSPATKFGVNGSVIFGNQTTTAGATSTLRFTSTASANFIQSGSTTTVGSAQPLIFGSIAGGATWLTLDASGNLQGTGTGSFTAVTSTVATGTAPFTVTSTTNVANLNASSLNGATFAAPGAIGSGTASTGAFTTLSASSTVSGTGFSTYLLSPPAIGTTAPAAGKFTDLTSTGNTTIGDASTDTLTINPQTISLINSTAITAASTKTLTLNGGAGSNGLFLDASNNVGIGTASPTAKLSFGATVGLDFATYEGSAGANKYGIGMGGAGTTPDPFRTKLYANGSEAVSITAAGLVGIGTTTPTQKLHVSTVGSSIALFESTSATAISAVQLQSSDGNVFVSRLNGPSSASPSTALIYTTGTIPIAYSIGGTELMRLVANGTLTLNYGSLTLIGSGGLGYGTGSGGAITQITSRTTGVTLNKTNGAITLVSAAGLATYQTFTVTNSTVAATDTIIVNQKSGIDKYIILVTAVAAGSFAITYATTGGTTTEQPVFNFSVIKAVTA
jgi:hypothetical protein